MSENKNEQNKSEYNEAGRAWCQSVGGENPKARVSRLMPGTERRYL
jgi:hypothetical protein